MDEQKIRQEEREMALRWIRSRILNSKYTSLTWVDGALLMEQEFGEAMEEDFASFKAWVNKVYSEQN
jgi:hypothetical protein